MPKPWARQRARREAERRQLAEEEGAAAVQSVSTLNSVSISPAPAVPNSWLFPLALGRNHPMYYASGVLPSPADDTPPPSLVDATPPPCWADDLPDPPSPSARAVALTLPPRDFSALRSDLAHPWRTIRRRNHRLLPPRRERRPFPQSLPKKTKIAAGITPVSASPAPPCAPIHVLGTPAPPPPPPPTSIPVPRVPPPSPPPPAPSPAIHTLAVPPHSCDGPHLFCPMQREPPPQVLPAPSAYGTVQSALALACAREFPWVGVAHRISDIAWGVQQDERQSYFLRLAPDLFVFLAVLTEIRALEPVFAVFLDPAITNFANAWVAHYDRLYSVG
ncbi:hypothetical protein B0H13DRAFT_1896454 [Mycena leptocephala]|nr:hypothetical protein B0H13DRAFT_1896454 [Mycena leptocephala]